MTRSLFACLPPMLGVAALACGTPLPASQKPCRDAAGKIIPCPKPKAASVRCKDAKGRFVACPAATPTPTPRG